MKLIFTIFFIQLFCLLQAQVVVKPQVITSIGKSFQKTNAGVSFTIGEIILKPKFNSNVSLSNGVISSAITFVVTKISTHSNDFKFELFPNPSSQFATFKMETIDDVAVLLKVTDLQGKEILEQNLPHSFNEYSFPVNGWSAGMYILNVYNQQNESLGFIKFQKL